jgi:hypothetical protein
MTDFLDRLETDLRDAAERRGQPRRRRPRPGTALKAVAIAVVLALLVVAGARLVDRSSTEHTAAPTPTPTPSRNDPGVFVVGQKVAVAAPAEISIAEVLTAPLDEDFTVIHAPADPSAIDPSLGTVVLYGPDMERYAVAAARALGIDDVRPMTAADEDRIHFDPRGAKVVAVFAADFVDALLSQARCTPGGMLTTGALAVCVLRRGERQVTWIRVDGKPLPVDDIRGVGHWVWAAASPDGKSILAQWSAECEVPVAYVIDAEGGRLRPFSADSSEAFGWTTDGRAIVGVRASPCGGGEAGLYLMTPAGDPTAIGKAVPRDLEPSIEPRTKAEVIGGR